MKQGLMRGLAAFTASLCAVSLVAASYAPTRAAFINSRLGTVSYRLEETGEQEGDSYYFESEFTSLDDLLAAKAELAEQISSEGTTLLKNTNAALPLDNTAEKVTLWGHNSVFNAKGGMIGSTASAAEGQDDFGLIDAMFARGFQLNEQMIGFLTSDEAFAYTRQTFFPGAGLVPSFEATWEAPAVYLVGEIPSSMYTDEVLASADDTAAVCVITRDSSEAADYEVMMFNGTEGDSFERPLALSQYEKDMIELAKQHSTKVIVLINANNPMELEELKNDPDIDAIVWAGEPGVYGFLGVADVLSGAANPSGHLPDTYAVNSASAPAMQNFGLYMYTNNSNNGSAQGDIPQLTTDNKADWYVVEQEGIYQGYKYYETRYEDEILGQGNATAAEGASDGSAWTYANEVSYPFGYGSSYTTFEQKLDSVNVNVGGLGEAQVTVTNTGDVAGKSVVELYVQSPYTEGGLEKSAIQLAGFAKTSVLEPGASETVSVEIDPALFASYDETVTKADGTVGAWVLEAGDYYFAIGNGVHNALNNILAAKTGSDAGLISVNDDEVISKDNAIVWNLGETDVETYSVNVENALQAADINKLIPDTAEYTTRSDWSKGWKTVE
ncbi:MAG: glycoside hydrolase family 3 C-terminal domain-containing protein, partial [Lachnospiraceae bacterium]|nr:glycoside hydrolase family 3 C-terminal domain-containing protein [Lachnospiraceae bacterium]